MTSTSARLFAPAGGPEDYAHIPPTRFRRKEHWLNAHFSGDGSVLMPGTHVAMPDGRHVWEYAPREATDLAALVKAAAAQVLPDAQLVASEQRAVPAENARLVTTLTRHPGGAAVQIHARIDESFTLVYDALVSRAGQASVLPTAVGAGAAIASTVRPPRRLRGGRAGSRRVRQGQRRDRQPHRPPGGRIGPLVTGFR